MLINKVSEANSNRTAQNSLPWRGSVNSRFLFDANNPSGGKNC